MKVNANGLEFEVEINDPLSAEITPDTPTVLLIMGLGMQLIAWPIAFVNALNRAGYRVVRLDKLMPRRYDSLTGRAARHSE